MLTLEEQGPTPQRTSPGRHHSAQWLKAIVPQDIVLQRPAGIAPCPLTYSVRRFRAAGDGARDDSGAILRAARSKHWPWLYFPPGSCRIARDVTIDKPILVGMGAALRIDKRATLTLNKPPQNWNLDRGMFAGKGAVRLGADVGQVSPHWFRQEGGESDSDALQRAIDSCAAECTVLLSKSYSITKPVYLQPNVRILSTGASALNGFLGRGQGVVMPAGAYTRPLQFGLLGGVADFALKIQGGARRADVQITSIMDSGDGVVFAPGEGAAPGRIFNVRVSHITSSGNTQNTVVMRGQRHGDTLQRCHVRGNFVVSSGRKFPGRLSSGLAIQGQVPPTLISSTVAFQAVDPVLPQFPPIDFTFLRNEAGAPADNVIFRVEAWGGGLRAPLGKVVEGAFRGLKSVFRMASDMHSQSVDVRGAENTLSMAARASAGREYPLPQAPSLAQFNGGRPVLDQVFYVRVPVQGYWGPGEECTFYLWSVLAPFAGSRIRYVPFRAGNAGLVVAGFENQDCSERNRIADRVLNSGSQAVPSWMGSFRFGVQVGPT